MGKGTTMDAAMDGEDRIGITLDEAWSVAQQAADRAERAAERAAAWVKRTGKRDQ